MYKETLPAGTALTKMIESPSSKIDTKSKVNQICNTMLEALRSRTSTHSQCVITAHLCKNPLDFEAGLTEITQIKRMYLGKPRDDKLMLPRTPSQAFRRIS